MTELTERQRRLARVDELRMAAMRLQPLTTHPSTLARVTTALNDLDEAATWLESPDVETRPSILQLVDVLLAVAFARLRVVDEVIARFGPEGAPLTPLLEPMDVQADAATPTTRLGPG